MLPRSGCSKCSAALKTCSKCGASPVKIPSPSDFATYCLAGERCERTRKVVSVPSSKTMVCKACFSAARALPPPPRLHLPRVIFLSSMSLSLSMSSPSLSMGLETWEAEVLGGSCLSTCSRRVK